MNVKTQVLENVREIHAIQQKKIVPLRNRIEMELREAFPYNVEDADYARWTDSLINAEDAKDIWAKMEEVYGKKNSK